MVNKDRKDEVRAIIESVFSEAPMANAIDDVKLSDCPFCGATPHRGPTKMQNDQLHGEPFQRYRVWCPKGHASFTEMTEGLAYAAWNTRSPAPSQHTGWSDEAAGLAAARKIANEMLYQPVSDGAKIKSDRDAAFYMVDKIKRAIEERAAASSIAPATGFEVKALEWDNDTVATRPYSAWYFLNYVEGLGWRYHYGSEAPYFPTKEEAKIAAQAHFAAAIRSSISPSVPKESGESIKLTPFEIQSGLTRVRWAELLIRQLPSDHDGRNSWLMNYGSGEDVERMRDEHPTYQGSKP